jgi:hypothetical protein
MKARFMLWLVVSALPYAVSAQQVSVAGGSTECAVWVEARAARNAEVLEHFVLGCLNGLSLGTGKEFWHSNSVPISRQSVFAAIDDYCRTNPTGMVVTGSIQLFNNRTRPPPANFQ